MNPSKQVPKMKNLITKIELAEDLGKVIEMSPRTPQKQQEAPVKGTDTFPLEVFPGGLQSLVREAGKVYGMPEEFASASILCAASVSAGNSVQIQMKKGQYFTPILWMAIIGRPGTNKTGSIYQFLKPVKRREEELYRLYQQQRAEWEADEDKGPKPILKRHLVSDVTIEALGKILSENCRGLGLLMDELANWLESFSRYKKGSDEAGWLQLWNGNGWKKDRTSQEEAILIRKAFVSVFGGIQPGRLEKLAANGRTLNGFIDRLLFVFPDNLEPPEWTEEELSPDLEEDYFKAISKILDLDFYQDSEGQKKPWNLTLDPEAKERWKKFFNKENRPLKMSAESDLLAGIHSKFDTHTARLIIPLHLLNWAYSGKEEPPLEVSLGTVEKAILLAEYFRKQALKVYDKLNNETPLDKEFKDRQILYESLPEKFKTGEGVKLAEKHGIPERTFKKWLKNKNLFDKVRHGEYLKLL
jgi:hypothetical protein